MTVSVPIVSLTEGLQHLSERKLFQMYERWIGGMPPSREAEMISNLLQQMANPFAVAEARARIYGDMLPIFNELVNAEQMLNFKDISTAVVPWEMPAKAIADCLTALVATGLVVRASVEGKDYWCVPPQITTSLDHPQTPSAGTSSPLALWGWLRQYLSTKVPRTALEMTVNNMHQLLVDEQNIASRLKSLEPNHHAALLRVVNEYGGLITKALFEEDFQGTDLFEFSSVLEKASLGSAFDINFEEFGLRHNASTLVVVHEVVLHLLNSAAPVDNNRMSSKVCVGTDFVANFSRFCSYLQQEKIRFTSKGAIYKTTGKRIAEDLLLASAREFSKFELLEMEFKFALESRLITGSGEKNFILTEKGEQFLETDLLEKQRVMLDWMVEEYSLRGDMSHQVRMRRSALSFLKTLEPGRWYDAMHLPYIVRNHYFSLLSSGQISPLMNGAFPSRSSSDSRELCWNLLLWLRKDIHLLGLLDIAYDDNDRITAIRLTSIGCELFGMLDLQEKKQTGHFIVNPDFEIVLFPSAASHRLIYDLDSFCDRERTDSLYHFRLTQQSVQRSLAQGHNLQSITSLLEKNSPTPIPQNVSYELQSWTKS